MRVRARASGAKELAGGLLDATGRYARRLHELPGSPGTGQAADREVTDADRVTCAVERLESRAADAALRIVVLDDDEPVPGRGRGLEERLRIDRLHRVQVHDPGLDAVASELVGRGQAVVQGHAGADQRHL